MLESLLNFREMDRRPYLAFAWGFALVAVSLVIAMQMNFTMVVNGARVNLTGLFALALALMPSAYIMTSLIRKEELLEEKAIRRHYGQSFWGRHEKDVLIFLYLFGGAALAFALATMVLPKEVFQVQISSICSLRPYMEECSTFGMTGAFTESSAFERILVNNLRVLTFSFLVAFIFGAGSAFIILWNAGILGIFIGLISKHAAEIPIRSLQFLPHGVPEIAGYVCAGLAGSLISTAMLRKADSGIVRSVALDSAKVLALGIFLIFLGALVEAYM